MIPKSFDILMDQTHQRAVRLVLGFLSEDFPNLLIRLSNRNKKKNTVPSTSQGTHYNYLLNDMTKNIQQLKYIILTRDTHCLSY